MITKRMSLKDKTKRQLRKFSVGDKFSHLPLAKASVLIPLLVRDGKLCVLFTVRSMKLTRSPGEVCFPGGRREPTDRDEIATALREAKEEVGLCEEQTEVICKLVPAIDKTRSIVTPVVAFIEDSFQAHPNPEEVSDVFYVPLDYFIRPLKYKVQQVQMLGRGVPVHFFEYDDPERNTSYQIWGLTAHFTVFLALAVFEEKPTFEIDYDLDNLISSSENNFLELYNLSKNKL
ncbi:peroxisomal coenzyme A diphosphatase NUDT7 isoform X2 [Paroedura picta]|uniref:peroxisomal coenzyme A diphosphatase NUDT7 isoform X2 n=1 Tax=Paroedura picta TaxID=143630 RepID=UPI004055A8B2